MQDVVVLDNLIRELLDGKENLKGGVDGGEGFGVEELDCLFKEYQGMRYGASKSCLEASMKVTRMHVWDSWGLWFLDWWVAPVVSAVVWMKVWLRVFGPGPQMANGYVLDFLRERERPRGLVPWARIPRVEMEESTRGEGE